MTKYLTADQVIELHDVLLENFGGLSGVRDKNLLYSALEAPKASFGGKEMYPSIYEKQPLTYIILRAITLLMMEISELPMLLP